jgi:hypothetical protein
VVERRGDRLFAGEQHVDRDAVLRVAHALAAGELLDVAAPEPVLLEAREAVGGDEDVDVVGHAAIAVLVEGHRSDDRVGDARLVERRDELSQRAVHIGVTHEEPPGDLGARPELRCVRAGHRGSR